MDTDFTSLERELRGPDGQVVPPAYADLAEEYTGDDSPDEDYEDLRKSG